MKQLLFILTLLIGTCFATHAKTIKLVPSALDSTRMDTVVISDLQDVNEDQNAAMHDISSDFGDWNSGPPTSAKEALIFQNEINLGRLTISEITPDTPTEG